ncbi:MAG: beta-mannosidase [Oscillospiraceae bacterium]|nr:beta-mannosidase [Oscillospiraceae bacterium]
MQEFTKRMTAGISAAVIACGALCALPVTAADNAEPFRVEGEDMEGATLWTSIYENQISDYSGEGFFYLTSSSGTITMTVPDDGMYQIIVRGAQILDENGRYQTVEVNGSEYHKTVPYADKWTDFDFGMVRLSKGENTIKFVSKYGYMAIDYVTISPAVFPDLSTATAETCDKDATPETKALMAYLQSVYGKQMLSGQQQIYGGGNSVQTTIRYDAATDTCKDTNGVEYVIDRDSKDKDEQGNEFYWHCTGPDGQVYTFSTQNHNYTYNNYNNDVNLIYDLTGKYPAIQGFDFGSYCPCYAWDDGVADRMIEWTNEKGGICTASWHINVPTVLADYTLGEPLDFGRTTYSEKTDFVTANCLKEGTTEYEYFRLCMDNLAKELLKLQEANVPLIFRPFHEAEGNGGKDGKGAWFWWAKEGTEVYKQLWAYLQDTLTNEYGLHNLIWEQNLYTWSDDSALWYSGDDRVDIVAYDKYNTVYNRHDGKTSGPNLDAESGIFYQLVGYVDGKKMVAMAENSTVPSLTNLQVEHANWLYFCPWYNTDQDPFVIGEEYQDLDELKKVYLSDFCITLDELPEDLFQTTVKPVSGTTTTTVKESDNADLLGDVNLDKEVDVEDAVLLARYLAEDINAVIDAQGKRNADMNASGAPDTDDTGLILQKIAKLI